MTKQEILDYVKGFYRTTRHTKNGLFIYSGVYRKPTSWNKTGEIYTYVSNEEIGVVDADDWIKEGLDIYMEEVKRFGGIKYE